MLWGICVGDVVALRGAWALLGIAVGYLCGRCGCTALFWGGCLVVPWGSQNGRCGSAAVKRGVCIEAQCCSCWDNLEEIRAIEAVKAGLGWWFTIRILMVVRQIYAQLLRVFAKAMKELQSFTVKRSGLVAGFRQEIRGKARA